MRKRRNARLLILLERHPIVSAILVTPAMWAFIFMGAAVFELIGQIHPIEMPAVRQVFMTGVPPIIFYLILRRLGWASTVGFNGAPKWKDLQLSWVPALLIPASLSNLIFHEIANSVQLWEVAAGFARGLSVAFLEETTFRGLTLAILLYRFHSTRRQIIGSVVLSSLVFGFAHLPDDSNWESYVAQWISAAFTGVGFAAVLLRTRCIWVLIAIHALLITSIIVVQAMTTGELQLSGPRPRENPELEALLSILVTMPLAIYGLYLLRDPKRLELGAIAVKTREPRTETSGGTGGEQDRGRAGAA